MKNWLLLFLAFASGFPFTGYAQKSGNDQQINSVLRKYENYKEPALINRLFKHSDIVPLIEKHTREGLLKDEVIGQSVQGRSIYHVSLGTPGKTKVYMWSQMHGDESTATMALFDLFNFLSSKDEYDNLRKHLLDNIDLHIVPMLNPDGAEIWTRVNAMNIDLNRDARILATPEANALMNLGKRLQPEFGFNLHDQSIYYAAGENTSNPATISFLAPAFDDEKNMNPVREKAVQLIVSINSAIQNMIPAKVAKYDDAHDARCFGDTFQEMGISTILIESGGYPNDPEKQMIRKVNFCALLTALSAIADKSYAAESQEAYWALPNNNRGLHDLIIRNVSYPVKTDSEVLMTKPGDLGINREQSLSNDLRSMNYKGMIVRAGAIFTGEGHSYQELDASGLTCMYGKTVHMNKKKWEKMSPKKENRFVKKGYLFVKWKDGPSPAGPVKNRLLNLTNIDVAAPAVPIGPANFILARNNKPAYAVINGFLVDLQKPAAPLLNTMGY